jgi:hypothetical protein
MNRRNAVVLFVFGSNAWSGLNIPRSLLLRADQVIE